jgi:hypothetical protein
MMVILRSGWALASGGVSAYASALADPQRGGHTKGVSAAEASGASADLVERQYASISCMCPFALAWPRKRTDDDVADGAIVHVTEVTGRHGTGDHVLLNGSELEVCILEQERRRRFDSLNLVPGLADLRTNCPLEVDARVGVDRCRAGSVGECWCHDWLRKQKQVVVDGRAELGSSVGVN